MGDCVQQGGVNHHHDNDVQRLEFDFEFTDRVRTIKSVFLHRSSVLCQQLFYLKLSGRRKFRSIGNERTDSLWGNIHVDFERGNGQQPTQNSAITRTKSKRPSSPATTDRIKTRVRTLARAMQQAETMIDIRNIKLLIRNGNDAVVIPFNFDDRVYHILIDVIDWEYYPDKNVRTDVILRKFRQLTTDLVVEKIPLIYDPRISVGHCCHGGDRHISHQNNPHYHRSRQQCTTCQFLKQDSMILYFRGCVHPNHGNDVIL